MTVSSTNKDDDMHDIDDDNTATGLSRFGSISTDFGLILLTMLPTLVAVLYEFE